MGRLEGEEGSPGMGMEVCTEAPVDLKDRRISHPEKDLLHRGRSQRRQKMPGPSWGQERSFRRAPHAGRAWGSPALRPRRRCSEGNRASRSQGSQKALAQGPRVLTEAGPPYPGLGVLPSVVGPVGTCLAGTQAPPALSTAVPLHPAATASLQSSQGHLWAHKIKYLKDVKDLSWFLWQQENNSISQAN